MADTSNCRAACGELSTSTDMKMAFPFNSLATSSNMGAKRWQGPHQVALKSMTMGNFSSGVMVALFTYSTGPSALNSVMPSFFCSVLALLPAPHDMSDAARRMETRMGFIFLFDFGLGEWE